MLRRGERLLLALSRQSARCEVWPLSVVKRSRIARCEAFSVGPWADLCRSFESSL